MEDGGAPVSIFNFPISMCAQRSSVLSRRITTATISFTTHLSLAHANQMHHVVRLPFRGPQEPARRCQLHGLAHYYHNYHSGRRSAPSLPCSPRRLSRATPPAPKCYRIQQIPRLLEKRRTPAQVGLSQHKTTSSQPPTHPHMPLRSMSHRNVRANQRSQELGISYRHKHRRVCALIRDGRCHNRVRSIRDYISSRTNSCLASLQFMVWQSRYRRL